MAHGDIQAADGKCWGKGLSWKGGRGVWVVDVGVSEFLADFYVYRNCDCNLERALVERFHDPGVLARERYELRKKTAVSKKLWATAFDLAKTVGDFGDRVPWEDDQVSQSYSGSKRREYERAFEDMPAVYSPWWAKVSPFVKIEKYTFYDKINRIPRPIQPRTMTYRAYLSKFIKPIELLMKSLVLPGCVYPFMAKGLSSSELAERFTDMWELFDDPVALSLDLKTCDGTIHPRLKELENAFFERFSEDDRFRECLLSQTDDEYVIYILEGIMMKLKHGRCSGDPQTGCGNTFIMGTTCRSIFDFKVEIFANGDDTIIIMEKGRLAEARLKMLNFSVFGLSVKEESCTDDIEAVSWCQSKYTLTSLGPMWIRDYKRVLATIFANVEYEPIKIKSLMSQIALAELYQNPGQPIIAPVCAWILSHLGVGRKYKFQFNQHTFNRSKYFVGGKVFTVPTLLDRARFCASTEITPAEQVAMENQIISGLERFNASQVKVTNWDGCVDMGLHPHADPN